MSEFFATNAPDPHHWTLNSCFGAFLSVWVHLGPFPYCTKLAAKYAKLEQLMQMFMPRSQVRIFCNEHSQSTPLDPKLIFWCVSFCLGAFGSIRYCLKLGAKQAELVLLVQKFVPRSRVGIFRNECSRSTTFDPKLMFCCIP